MTARLRPHGLPAMCDCGMAWVRPTVKDEPTHTRLQAWRVTWICQANHKRETIIRERKRERTA